MEYILSQFVLWRQGVRSNVLHADPARWGALVLYISMAWVWLLAPGFIVTQALPIGGLLLLFSVCVLFYRMRNHFALFDLVFPLTLLSMWVAPACWYPAHEFWPDTFPYPMPLSAENYFSIAIPGIMALLIGGHLGLPLRMTDGQTQIKLIVRKFQASPSILWATAGLGLAGNQLSQFLPETLHQIGAFTGNLLWVAGIGFMLTRARLRWMSLAIWLFMLWQAIQSTMFGEWVFWTIAGGFIWLLAHPMHWSKQLLVGVGGILSVILLIGFKYEYRAGSGQYSSTGDKAVYFIQTLKRTIVQPDWMHIAGEVLPRVNQGYLTALAYDYVPSQTPFVAGETINTAVKAALIPRIFWPDKPRSGGQENFTRFTGQSVDYSCNIGPFGDAYVNYGPKWSVVFLFFYGFGLRLLYDTLLWSSRHMPMMILMMPIVFLTAISIEMDVLTILNVAVKGSLFVFIVSRLMNIIQKSYSSSPV